MSEAQAPVELVLEGHALEDGRATLAGAGRVTRLSHEVPDHAMEDAPVVIALEAELHKVAAGERRLLGPELDVERTDRRVQDTLPIRRRLRRVDVQVSHASAGGERSSPTSASEATPTNQLVGNTN